MHSRAVQKPFELRKLEWLNKGEGREPLKVLRIRHTPLWPICTEGWRPMIRVLLILAVAAALSSCAGAEPDGDLPRSLIEDGKGIRIQREDLDPLESGVRLPLKLRWFDRYENPERPWFEGLIPVGGRGPEITVESPVWTPPIPDYGLYASPIK